MERAKDKLKTTNMLANEGINRSVVQGTRNTTRTPAENKRTSVENSKQVKADRERKSNAKK